jgi:uncharacterized 2Fe-2S/4Fe-4S cluster protein (DUF4445 family)
VGTTTIAGSLLDRITGETLATGSLLNQQVSFGADVISRISYVSEHHHGLALLHQAVVDSIAELWQSLRRQSGIEPEDLAELVAVGNTTMIHLLLGLSPEPIGVAPFLPAFTGPVSVPALEIGLPFGPHTRCCTLPHLGAYAGADLVAGALATNLLRLSDDKVRLYIDLGTNTEMVLGSSHWAIATSAPAGPAFEGAQIQCGMRATEGAIDDVRIDGEVHYHVIGGGERPAGICGSGLISAVAALRASGRLDASGRLTDGPLVLGGVTLTQKDIRAVQYAKAAIASAIRILLARTGTPVEEIHQVLLAGSFGSSIDPACARRIGLVPGVAVERIASVGNAACEGAAIALLSMSERQAANQIPAYVEYVELSGSPEFDECFIEELQFGGD